MVRVHSSVGVAVVPWCGNLQKAEGPHHVEWTVDEDIVWGENAQPTAQARPCLRQAVDRVVMRGRLHLTPDGAAVLEMGDTQILFDLASPLPDGIDPGWVELTVDTGKVGLWPYQL